MKGSPSLDDALLFLAVAETGSLAGAGRATGASVPTLSRRMTQLELQIGGRLFRRGAHGYALTSAGRALQREVEGLRDVERRLQQLATRDHAVSVRITAGDWTSQFVALNVLRWWSTDDDWVPEFLSATADLDIARRGADIGIRNRRPTQGWLAGKKVAEVPYGIFALSDDIEGYITLPDAADLPPTARWVRTHHAAQIRTTVNSARLAVDLALAGAGRVVLPLFAAPLHPTLKQIGPEIDALRHAEWLVSHHEARHDPAIRQALDALATLLENRALRP